LSTTLLPSTPHRRYNPLKDEWVLVSPQRTQRPWQGRRESLRKEKQPTYNPTCFLCPGNTRANGDKNPSYQTTFVFQNDFPALINNAEDVKHNEVNLLKAEQVEGECRVVCFSPRHDLTLAEMSTTEIGTVIDAWNTEVDDLKKKYQWVQIFENKGELMGCSNPHPHGQIWASNFIPSELEIEDREQKNYFAKNHSPLLVDYLEEELKKKERIVVENNSWVTLVPFWAVWPFETMLLPKTYKPHFEFSDKEKGELTSIMKSLLVAYDKLFETSMPYSMGWHFAPFTKGNDEHWQLHAHYYPPLLRSATVKKFMVGYEMLAEAQRDITPEQAAQQLRILG